MIRAAGYLSPAEVEAKIEEARRGEGERRHNQMNRPALKGQVAKLMLWQHEADEYDFDELEKCWQKAGEPTHDTYLRWSAQVLNLLKREVEEKGG